MNNEENGKNYHGKPRIFKLRFPVMDKKREKCNQENYKISNWLKISLLNDLSSSGNN